MRVGRAPNCHVVLTEAHVSNEHATLKYVGDGAWVIRDLGSKNGTFVNGRRIVQGDVKLAEDDVVSFGADASAWRFAAGDPCEMIAVNLADGLWTGAAAGELLLAIPSPEVATATLLRRGTEWLLEAPGADSFPLADGHLFAVLDSRYRVWFSISAEPTQDAVLHRHRLFEAALHLAVSRDEEHVEAEFDLGEVHLPLPARVYLYLLVILGRYRREDAAAGMAVTESGWRYADDVAHSLGFDQQTLNVYIHRTRQDIAKLGFTDPAAIIERRTLTKQLRLGIPPTRVVLSTL
jgi:hypothetical protein